MATPEQPPISSGLVAFFDARYLNGVDDSAQPSDGAAVTNWVDIVSATLTATNADSTERPLYRAPGSGIGTVMAALDFDGTNDALITANFTRAQPFTVYLLVQFDDGVTTQVALGNGTDVATGRVATTDTLSASFTVAFGALALGAGTPHSIASVANTTSSVLRRDGLSETTGSGGGGAWSAEPIVLGAFADSSLPFDGKIGIALIYSGAHDFNQRAVTESWLLDQLTDGLSHDPVVTESIETGTTDPHTFSHTPVHDLKGVWLTAVHGTDSTDHISGVTYGGVAMTRVASASDSASETGRTYLYFLGSNIPTGSQTVSVDTDATTTDIQYTVGGFYGVVGNMEVVDSEVLNGDQTNPSVSLSVGGRRTMAIGALYSGHDAVSSVVTNVNEAQVSDNDFGSFIAAVAKQSVASTSDFTFSWTATSEDCALVAASFAEAPLPTIQATATVGSPTLAAGSVHTATTIQAVATVPAPDDIEATSPDAEVTDKATVQAVATVGAPTFTVIDEPATIQVVATVGAPTFPLSPATIQAVATVGTPIFALAVASDTALGGLDVSPTVGDSREGWTAVIISPLDGALVTTGALTVIVELLAPDGAEANIQVDISEYANFIGPSEAGDEAILDSAVSAPVGDGETATVTLQGLEADTTYYLRARGGIADESDWGEWSATITAVTAAGAIGEAYAYLYASDVDTSVPVPHLWSAEIVGDTIELIGAGFGDPQSEYNGEVWGVYDDITAELTVVSWDRVAATGNATTSDRTIVYAGDADPEHDIVYVNIPDPLIGGSVGVFVATEEDA